MNKYNIIARKLRKNQTPEETKIWNLIRNNNINGLKFRRQYPIGQYIVDFVCKEIKLIIEIDGGQHNTIEGKEADNTRSEYLQAKGYKILRYWNNDINKNIDGVIENIIENIKQIAPSPYPSP